MNKINIALPKGRLLKKVYDLFKKIGYENEELLEDNRKLVFEDKGVRYLIVKPSDVGRKRSRRYRNCRKRYSA